MLFSFHTKNPSNKSKKLLRSPLAVFHYVSGCLTSQGSSTWNMNTTTTSALWRKGAHERNQIHIDSCHVEDTAPLNEAHVLGVLLVPDDEADACNLFEIDNRRRQRRVGRIGTSEIIFEALAQAECDRPLRVMIDLDLPERAAISLSRIPLWRCRRSPRWRARWAPEQ